MTESQTSIDAVASRIETDMRQGDYLNVISTLCSVSPQDWNAISMKFARSSPAGYQVLPFLEIRDPKYPDIAISLSDRSNAAQAPVPRVKTDARSCYRMNSAGLDKWLESNGDYVKKKK